MIYTFGHCYPYTDIDSLVGSIVLAEILRNEGKEAEPILLEGTGLRDSTKNIFRKTDLEMPRFLEKKELERETSEFALVDHNNTYESFGRLGIKKEIFLCIDHHYIEDNFKFKTMIYRRVGSACTILGEIIKYKNMKIKNIFARALVYGIVSDTMGLKSIKTSPHDLEIMDYLFNNFEIKDSLETITSNVAENVDILNMDIKRILTNSLKEYLDGDIGIARIVVLTDKYKKRFAEINKHGWKMNYKLFVFVIYKQHEEKTDVYFFDNNYGCFETQMSFNNFISRSQDLLPYILKTLKQKNLLKS